MSFARSLPLDDRRALTKAIATSKLAQAAEARLEQVRRDLGEFAGRAQGKFQFTPTWHSLRTEYANLKFLLDVLGDIASGASGDGQDGAVDEPGSPSGGS